MSLLMSATLDSENGVSKFRALRRMTYKRTAFSQRSHECASLSLANLVLSRRQSLEFLTDYELLNYQASVMNFKSIIKNILVTSNIPFEKIIIS